MLPKLPLAKLTTKLFFSVLFCALFLTTPFQVNAQATRPPSDTSINTGVNEKVGTHLGAEGADLQVGIMNILSANGAGSGFPVTLMVSTSTSLSELQTLAAGVEKNGFFPIVRINSVCEGADAVRIVTDTRTAFGPDVPIEYGNEVNNKVVECTDYGNYKKEYEDVLALELPNVGFSALDFYNDIYPAAGLLTAVTGGSQLKGNVFFANAYGCVGTPLGECDISSEAANTHPKGYEQITGNPLYLTEFGIVPYVPPGVDFADHYAGSGEYLQKTIDFIESRASSVPASAITPLIRNVCDDDGPWLLYLHGKILTQSGVIIDPATCSADESAIAPYYLYPIESLKEAFEQGIPAKAAAGDIAMELIDQGYEVSCTAPQGLFRATLERWPLYAQYIDPTLASLPQKLFGFSQKMDYTDVQYPLFRNETKATNTNSSIEAHFGYLDTSESLSSTTTNQKRTCKKTDPDDPRVCLLYQDVPAAGISTQEIGKETKSAALYKLLTPEQQCQYQKNILTTINTMCNKLADPTTCALYQEIPGSTFTTKTLFPLIDTLSCDVVEKNNAIAQDPSGELAKQYQALQNTPLYLDKAYRLGFVVFSAEQKEEASLDKNDGNGWDFLFDRENNLEAKPRDEVRIIAFKLPDTGTNKNSNSDIYYKDPLFITRDILTPQDTQIQRDASFSAQREQFKINAESASKIDFPDKNARIDCSGPACEDPLGRALVNLINSGKSNFNSICQRAEEPRQEQLIRFEPSDTIQTEGRLNAESALDQPTSAANGAGTFFAESFQLLKNIFRQPEDSKLSPESFELEGTTAIIPGPNKYRTGLPSEAKFTAYLIYPVGYELKTVTDTLAGLIKTQDQVETLPNNLDYDPYLILSGIEEEFYTNIASFTYNLTPGQDGCSTDPLTGEPLDCERKIFYKAESYLQDFDFDIGHDSIEFEPRVEGGMLGNIMRDIQLSLRDVGSDAWHYINSCKTTEDFLLGRCDKNATADKITTDGIAGTCSELYGSESNQGKMTVYDREQTFNRVIAAAKRSTIPADEQLRFAQTLWGILEIEGNSYLKVMNTVLSGETSEISCAKTITSCGSVGPLQITEGACVTESCPLNDADSLRKLNRSENLCDIDTSLDWATENLLRNYDSSIQDIDERHAAMAGAHAGLGTCNEPATSQAIQGCSVEDDQLLNYCDCASIGYEEKFNTMMETYNGTNATVTVN